MPQGTKGHFSNNQKKVAQNPGTSFLSSFSRHHSTEQKCLSSSPPWRVRKRISFNDTVRYSEVPGAVPFKCSDFIYYFIPGLSEEEMSQSCKEEKQIFEAALWVISFGRKQQSRTGQHRCPLSGPVSLCRRSHRWGHGLSRRSVTKVPWLSSSRRPTVLT